MADRAARTLHPEDEISHYRIVGPLGVGGMGEVYVAQDRTLDRKVALKVLPPDLVRSEERIRRFVLEAKSASSLSHPNIVTIYEIGQDAVRSSGEPSSAPVHFISMELVNGTTLSTLVHQEKTDLRTLIGYLAQAADGLAKAHAAGIVHRDLKPGNIMVSADGFAKVLDFGLAKLTEKSEADPEISNAPTVMADATGEGVVLGTAGYMSPEQVMGKTVDHRSDIFSFGCILYEAATRRRPFIAETAIETMHKILNEKPPPVEESDSQAPAELRRLIRRCLAKSPDQRFQSMKDLAIELREIADDYEQLSVSDSPGSIMAGAPLAPGSRRRTRVVIAVAAALIAVTGLAVGWRLLRGSRPESQPFQTMRMTPQTNVGNLISCALSPDGRYLAYLAGRAGKASFRVRQIATGSDVEVLPTKDAVIQNPSFSPDGNYLFYTLAIPEKQNYRALFQVPSLGGASRELAFDVDSRVSFSPDGKQLAFWRRVSVPLENRLIVLDRDSAKERVLAVVATPEVIRGSPSWSPDGRLIAGVLLDPGKDLQSSIVFFDPATGKREDFAKLRRTLLTSIAWLGSGSGLVSSGLDLKASIQYQVFLHSYPGGRTSRVTNDFNQYSDVSTSLVDDTIAALRSTQIGNLWIADASGAPPRRLTSNMNPENTAFGAEAASADTIVYDSPDGRNLQVWAMSLDGGEARLLTTEEAHSVNVRSSGGVVVFDRLDGTGVHVWRMLGDGTDRRPLTSGAGEQIVDLSPDGRHVILNHYDALSKLSIISTEDGHLESELSDVSGIVGFSPDSRSIMFGKPEKDARGLTAPLWTVVPIGGGASTASLRLPQQALGPRWAPDGRGVTFRNRSDPSWNVYRQAFDGGQPTAVTHFTDGRLTEHRWSPDGRRLAVNVQVGQVSNMWVVEADGSRPAQVTQLTSETVFGFQWMPDSRRVVLSAGISSSDAVLIRDFR